MGANPAYVGGTASIDIDDIPALIAGAMFYGSAVGQDSAQVLASWLCDLLDRNGPVPLLKPEAAGTDLPAAGLCVVGSASALSDLPPSGDEFQSAVRRLEATLGIEYGAIYPLAEATVSALVPVIAASQLGVPLLDVGGMGRVFALIHHTAMYLGGVPAAPYVAYSATGECAQVEGVSGRRADTLLRAFVNEVGGWVAFAGYSTLAGSLRRAGLPGTVSRLINVGRLLLAHDDLEIIERRLTAAVGARQIGRGRIGEIEHLSRADDLTMPAHPSSLVVDEAGGRRRQFRLELRSEIIAVFVDGELAAAVPDVICLMDVSRRQLAPLDALDAGTLVDILVTPADAIWYSPAGLAMVGLRSHGIPLDHPRTR